MNLNTSINTIILCVLNVSFMVAGIFLNCLVVISLWRSIQLRKKLCYFMILVLSCFDLITVTVNHPVLIISTLLWSVDMYDTEIDITRLYTSIVFGSFSVLVLLTLTIERFLSIMFPIFHRNSVTKKRLVYFLAFQIIIGVALIQLYYFAASIIADVLMTVVLLLNSLAFVFLNCKMLLIKSKHENERIAPAGTATPIHQGRKERMKNTKSISRCSLAVACFFICFSPEMINAVWRFTTKAAWYDRQAVIFRVWSNTLIAMNSTFNCLIFFWRNSILRREGLKVAKCLWTKKS